jgi:ankyrin repeat protein
MAFRVNTRAVEAAQRRRVAAAAAGRTYEQQLQWEFEHGNDLGGNARGFNQGAAPGEPIGGRGRSRAQGPGPAPTPPAGTVPAAAAANAAAAATTTTTAAPANVAAPAAADDPDNFEFAVAGLVGTGGGGLTALVFAAREGDLASAKALVDAGADVNQTTFYNWSPLLTAVNNRQYKLAAFLIERGANVNLANKGAWTPLYLAADNRNIEGGDYPVPKPDMDHLELIALLLDKGANPNAAIKDDTLTRTIFTMQWFYENGATPFIRAAQSSDVALMQLLLRHGADPKVTTAHGDSALTAAAGIGWVEGVTYERSAKENLEAVRLLVDLGLDVNHANRDGRTPLMGAAMKGRNDVVQLLVDRGGLLDQRDKGSRDTDTVVSVAAGATWQAIDYADGLVRTGVQSAVARPDTSALIRKLMMDRRLPVPPPNRTIHSICVVSLCQGMP